MAGPLQRAFVAVQLGAPALSVEVPLGGGADWPGFAWFAASLGSLAPMMDKLGIVTPEQLDLAGVAARAEAEAVETGVPRMLLPVVCAWARQSLA